MPHAIVDSRSDTVTRPTPGMRAAMASAEVGDDVYGEDPTVNALQERAAALVGMEAGLFVASGTMGNQVALCAHTRRGDEVILERSCHIVLYEGGGMAANAGVQPWALAGNRGALDPDEVERSIRHDDSHEPRTALIAVEDTHNRGGGAVQPLDALDALVAVGQRHGVPLHMDGARAWNAAIASGVPLSRRCRGFASVSLCLSKGLGAPVGSVLCGLRAFIHEAHRARKRLGGGMRQAGILAAAGLYALDHHVERLADDHRRAARLAEALGELRGVTVTEPQTNLLYLGVPGAPALAVALEAQAVLVSATGPDGMRLVTHLDVDDADIERTIAAFRAQLGSA